MFARQNYLGEKQNVPIMDRAILQKYPLSLF